MVAEWEPADMAGSPAEILHERTQTDPGSGLLDGHRFKCPFWWVIDPYSYILPALFILKRGGGVMVVGLFSSAAPVTHI